ncbi:MAG: pyruvate kinase [Anaerolineae bacterium]
MRHTKIVATLGPATNSLDSLRALVHAGVNVVRLNMSHGDHAEHADRIARIRHVAAEMGQMIALLADLQGPKLRIGELVGGEAELQPGAPFTLTTESIMGDASRATAPYPELAHDAKPGNRILLADGNLELVVTGTTPTTVETTVVHGGTLRSHQGVNLPGVETSLSSLTDKDRRDLAFVAQQNVDYIALSFVRHQRDIQELRYALLALNAKIPIIAKIEKVEALEHIDAIIAAADGIMVARGDLGVEAPPERVPVIQKMLIQKTRLAAKPVITATQMLESMIHSPRPTRAEASDVANAILDGTDAIMLSAETAIGQFPVEAVEMMSRIARVTEPTLHWEQFVPTQWRGGNNISITDAISLASIDIAAELHASAILAPTASGMTARAVARWRPAMPVIAASHDATVARRLALVRGVIPIVIGWCDTSDDIVARTITGACAGGYIHDGECIIVTSGMPVGIPGRTNSLQVQIVGEQKRDP